MANFGKTRTDEVSPTSLALKEGILFTFHQNIPIVEPDILGTIWCVANQITKKGILLGENERLLVPKALKTVAINGVYQYSEEDREGNVRKGKRAGLIILDKNSLAIPPEETRDIQVLETYKDDVQMFRFGDQIYTTYGKAGRVKKRTGAFPYEDRGMNYSPNKIC